MNIPWLTILAVLPAVGAVALIFSGVKAAKQVALAVSLITLAFALYIATTRFTIGGGMQLVEQVPWIKPLGVYYALGLDGLGLTLVLLVVIITPVVIIASWRDFDGGVSADPSTGCGNHCSEVRLPGLLCLGARSPELCAVPLPGHRRVLVLRVLRGHPGPDVLPDRWLRAGAASDVRSSQVLDLRLARRLCDARLDDRLVRAIGPGRGSRATC